MNKDLFHTSNWRKLSFEERLEALQMLENDYAKKQGRAPRIVEAEKMEGLEYMGYYNPKQDLIKINEDHVKRDDYNYCCVETVIHEGRHAYQIDVIQYGSSSEDQMEVQKWAENAVALQGNDKPFLCTVFNL